MDRREKALRVIDQYSPGYGHEDGEVLRFLTRHGGFRNVACDDLLAAFAMFLVTEWKRAEQINRRNRERRNAA